jgi:hypothetical protein
MEIGFANRVSIIGQIGTNIYTYKVKNEYEKQKIQEGGYFGFS